MEFFFFFFLAFSTFYTLLSVQFYPTNSVLSTSQSVLALCATAMSLKVMYTNNNLC